MKELIKLNFINLRLSALSKTLSREEAAKPQTEKLSAYYISNKGQLSKRHREPLKVNKKKRNSPVPMWEEDLNRHFRNEAVPVTNIRWP